MKKILLTALSLIIITCQANADLRCLHSQEPYRWARLSKGDFKYNDEIAHLTDGYNKARLICGQLDHNIQCVGYYFHGPLSPIKLNLDLKTKIAKVKGFYGDTLILKCDEVPPLDRN